MEEKYSFSVEGLYGNLTAAQIAAELNRISSIYGELKPEYVVKESKKKDSLLHNCFEWDDKAAAHKFRIEQAAKIIRNIQIELTHDNVAYKIRAFVNVRDNKDLPRTYVPTIDAILNEESYKDLMEQAKRDMHSFVTIYSQLSELNSVKAEMLKVLAQ